MSKLTLREVLTIVLEYRRYTTYNAWCRALNIDAKDFNSRVSYDLARKYNEEFKDYSYDDINELII